MSGGDILGGLSLLVTAVLGVLMWVNSRKQTGQGDRKITVEEQVAEDAREDVIAERRRVELERLYSRVGKLEEEVQALKKSGEDQERTIKDQADELERTNDVLSNVRHLFTAFVHRVQVAWEQGHSMPTLTAEELRILEDTYQPRSGG